MELDWTETFFRMLDLIVELIESPLDWIGGKNRTWFWILPSYVSTSWNSDFGHLCKHYERPSEQVPTNILQPWQQIDFGNIICRKAWHLPSLPPPSLPFTSMEMPLPHSRNLAFPRDEARAMLKAGKALGLRRCPARLAPLAYPHMYQSRKYVPPKDGK